jgi:hypothetical protein
MRPGKFVVDVDYAQFYKQGQRIGGDVFLYSRNPERNRIVCTLSDGLGSGVKANVLASMTAHMAQKLSFSPINAVHSAEIIMNTLPVCKERKISYSTFSIIQILLGEQDGITAQLIEYDNPRMFLFDRSVSVPVEQKRIILDRPAACKDESLSWSSVGLENGCRLIMLTDGVTQAGLGTHRYPLGWRRSAVGSFIQQLLKEDEDISSKGLARAIIQKARALDAGLPKDDITCAVVTVRRPRDLIIATGPPYRKSDDAALVEQVMDFQGKKIISGGTTAQIFSRECHEEVRVDLSSWNADIPPASSMKGVDLVTEGMLTLNRVAVELERRTPVEELPPTAVRSYLELLLNSDRVFFVVGTTINEAHQDPNIPFEIGIRRTIIHRIRTVLEDSYLKETSLSYL